MIFEELALVMLSSRFLWHLQTHAKMNKRPQAIATQLSSRKVLPPNHKYDMGNQRQTRLCNPAVTRQTTVNSEPGPQERQLPRRSTRRSSQAVPIVNAKVPKVNCEAKDVTTDLESMRIEAPASTTIRIDGDSVPASAENIRRTVSAATRLRGKTTHRNSIGLLAASENAPRTRVQTGREPSEVRTPKINPQKFILSVSDYTKVRRLRRHKNENSIPGGSEVQAVEPPSVPSTKLPTARPSELSEPRNDPKERFTSEVMPASPAITAIPPISAIPVTQSSHSYNTRFQSNRRSPAAAASTSADVVHIQDLPLNIEHHADFEMFSTFDDLKHVHGQQLGEHSKHATMVYTSKSSCQLALTANPHSLNGKDYNCHNAEDEQKVAPQGERSEPAGHNDQMPIRPLPVHVSSCPKPASKAVSHAPATPIIEAPGPSGDSHLLFASLGEKCKIKRHSYTNFTAYKKQPGQYEAVPLDSKVGLTAVAYAGLRDKPKLISFFYS